MNRERTQFEEQFLSSKQLLKQQFMRNFLKSNRSAEERVKDAVDWLAGKPKNLEALKKILISLESQKVNVFFSYTKKDEEAVEAIVNELEIYSAGKINFTYMAGFNGKEVGREYREEIFNGICNANLFLLLRMNSADDCDWCMYETGIFEAHRTPADRLICIYHPMNNIPNQTSNDIGVCATLPDLKDFLKTLFINPGLIPGWEPINDKIEEPKIEEIAKNIYKALHKAPPRKSFRQLLQPWIELRLAGGSSLNTAGEFDEAMIAACNKEALDIFDHITMPNTWGELRSGVTGIEMDARWRLELFEAVKMISRGRKCTPIQAVFKTKSGKMYRPMACAVDRMGSEQGPIDKYHVTFIEDVSTTDYTSMPAGLPALATVLRFSFRFRWEVLERFTRPMIDEEVEYLKSTFERIQRDWQSRGIGQRKDILELFPADKTDRLIRIFHDYDALRNPEGTGELDVAIKNKNCQEIPAILRKILPMNQEFLEMATERFWELVSGKPAGTLHS